MQRAGKLFSKMVAWIHWFFLRRLGQGCQNRADWSSENIVQLPKGVEKACCNERKLWHDSGCIVPVGKGHGKTMLTASLWKRSNFLHPGTPSALAWFISAVKHLWFLWAPDGGARLSRLFVVRGTRARRAEFFFCAPRRFSCDLLFVSLVDAPT